MLTTIKNPPIPFLKGKIREIFDFKNQKAIFVTDRISAFDFVLGTVKNKGQVLNEITAWWFDILNKENIPNHFIKKIHPNGSLVKTAKIVPFEVIIRGYLTGTTKTSSWYAYENLNREICGITMPSNMKKNQKFETPLITPTTKPEIGSKEHDVAISREKIIASGKVTEETWQKIEKIALKTFAIGQKIAKKNGLILVDTKYEFGWDKNGDIMIIDEVHTPDSSRYWVAESYEENFAKNKSPEMLDKEFVRKMIVEAGYNVNSDQNPADFFTAEFSHLASQKYQKLFETITGKTFIADTSKDKNADVIDVLKNL